MSFSGLSGQRRRVIVGTTIGTAIEWYDYFLYANVAGIVFNQVMFSSEMSQSLATILSFLIVGISFLFRPLGAFLAGHAADVFGRRIVLMTTLIAMGCATVTIGLLPTYGTIGVWAPILLVVLRIIQGVSAGGEWGSAVLMAVEHAPNTKRGLYGAGPQLGTPFGLLLASGALAIMSVVTPGEEFIEWGWRVPFLASAALIIVGLFIRHGVEESPVYAEMVARPSTAQESKPVAVLFSRFSPVLIAAALVMAANSAVGYMTTGGFVQSYATDPDGPALGRAAVLGAVTASAALWALTTLTAGWLSDTMGRKNSLLLGFVLQGVGAAALFPLIHTGSIYGLLAGVMLVTVGLGMTYGQIAAMYAELYPASIRSSGTSITYAISSILGGAFAPMIAAALVDATGSTTAVTMYLVAMTAIGFIATTCFADRTGIPLGAEYEEQQATGHFVWQKPKENPRKR